MTILWYTPGAMGAQRDRRGQAMLEYVLVFAALAGAVLALAVFVEAARDASVRTAELVASECP